MDATSLHDSVTFLILVSATKLSRGAERTRHLASESTVHLPRIQTVVRADRAARARAVPAGSIVAESHRSIAVRVRNDVERVFKQRADAQSRSRRRPVSRISNRESGGVFDLDNVAGVLFASALLNVDAAPAAEQKSAIEIR